jgi:hypothetical protein
MARIKLVEIVDQLAPQVRGALDEAVERAAPGVAVDRALLYREFRRALGTRVKMWENVPNSTVDAE